VVALTADAGARARAGSAARDGLGSAHSPAPRAATARRKASPRAA
jgi:hypothetical protein